MSQNNEHQVSTAVVNSSMHPHTSFPSFPHSILPLSFTPTPWYMPACELWVWSLGPPSWRTTHSQGKEAYICTKKKDVEFFFFSQIFGYLSLIHI